MWHTYKHCTVHLYCTVLYTVQYWHQQKILLAATVTNHQRTDRWTCQPLTATHSRNTWIFTTRRPFTATHSLNTWIFTHVDHLQPCTHATHEYSQHINHSQPCTHATHEYSHTSTTQANTWIFTTRRPLTATHSRQLMNIHTIHHCRPATIYGDSRKMLTATARKYWWIRTSAQQTTTSTTEPKLAALCHLHRWTRNPVHSGYLLVVNHIPPLNRSHKKLIL